MSDHWVDTDMQVEDNNVSVADEYNGHPSWAHWNVALWFGNDEPLHRLAREAANSGELARLLFQCGYDKTPDDATLTPELIEYAWESVQDE